MAAPMGMAIAVNVTLCSLKNSLNSYSHKLFILKYGAGYNTNKLLWRALFSTCSSSLCQSSPENKAKPTEIGNASAKKAQKISMAMKAYLERAKSHDAFMQEEITEYEIGKRHLANIMGEDPDMFQQEDIDRAIEYLLPSGLFDKKARPFMKHPSLVIPPRKAAQFGVDGRPFNTFFYTALPNYYSLMHEISEKVDELKKYEDKMLSTGEVPDENTKVYLSGSEWIGLDVIQQQLQEKVSEHLYVRLTCILQRLSDQAYSNREKEFIFKYRKPLQVQGIMHEVPPLLEAESGRKYMESSGKRKSAQAKVKVWDGGTGKFLVNGKDMLSHFPRLIDREQLLYPLQFTELLEVVDVEATVEGGGPNGQAGAIRFAMSLALQSFVSREMVEQMRLAGLLTWDPRVRERKKPGQKRARKKFTWKKR